MYRDIVGEQPAPAQGKSDRRPPGENAASTSDPSPTAAEGQQAEVAHKARVKTWAPRARTGCGTCRARRVKCDERVPICRKCLVANRPCDMSVPLELRLRRGEPRTGDGREPEHRTVPLSASVTNYSHPPACLRSLGHLASLFEYDYMQACYTWDAVYLRLHTERKITAHGPYSEVNWHYYVEDTMKPSILLYSVAFLLSEQNQSVAEFDKAKLPPDRMSLIRKYQHYTGVVIRALSRDLEHPETYAVNFVFRQLVCLIKCEIALNSPNVPLHLKGAITFLKSRGGIRKVLERKDTVSFNIDFVLIAITALNTTSPAEDCIVTDLFDDDDAFLVYTPFLLENFPSPTQLYRCTVDINRLRYQAVSGQYTEKMVRAAIAVIFESIYGFDPKTWEERPLLKNAKVRLLIAQMFRCATELYLRLSLSQYMTDPLSLTQRVALANRIILLVEDLIAICGYHFSQAWPLTVAGAALGHAPVCYQAAIERYLLGISTMLCSSRGIFITVQCLQRFWASGKTGWEDCFTKWQLCCF